MQPDQIHENILKRYAAVARQATGQFNYPVGRESAEHLQYRRDFLDRVSRGVVERFVGVGNPFLLGEPQPGSIVLDIGCGCGLDSQLASMYVGLTGRVCGVDLSEDMLAVARQGQVERGLTNLEYRQGDAESLPVPSGWADLIISNGVLNLATCKLSAFREVYRVLKPGGFFQAVDLLLVKDLPHDLRNDQFAWSN